MDDVSRRRHTTTRARRRRATDERSNEENTHTRTHARATESVTSTHGTPRDAARCDEGKGDDDTDDVDEDASVRGVRAE